MKKRLADEFNKQINREYYSAYLYLAMSDWLLNQGWVGGANWMLIQYTEEIQHAEGLLRYLQLRGQAVVLEKIDKPKAKWNSLLDVFEDADKHEKEISEYLRKLRKLAVDEDDQAAQIFLDWYILEQVEEEEHSETNILAIQRCADDRTALIMLDNHWAERQYQRAEIPHLG